MKKNSRILAIIIALMMAACFSLYGCGSSDSTADSETKPVKEKPQLQATLFFASDYQSESGWGDPEDTLDGILKAASHDGKSIDEVIMCGDYTNDPVLHDYQLSPDGSIAEIKSVVTQDCPNVNEDDMLFVQGNHDAKSDMLDATGLYEFEDYLVYVLNTQDDFPWKQGKEAGSHEKVAKAAATMEKCLNDLIGKGETRPVIIAGHVPLHFTARTSSRHTTGDNLYSALMFDVVNKAAESLDIIYLFGHNHSKGWDCYIGGGCIYRAPGDEILIPGFTDTAVNTNDFMTETLNFTYMNAGYVGYYMNCSSDESASAYSAADETLTGTVCEIYSDRIELTRYDVNGVHNLGADGEADPYLNYVDKDLIPEKYYSVAVKSPQKIKRK